jgi:hypothetical protein
VLFVYLANRMARHPQSRTASLSIYLIACCVIRSQHVGARGEKIPLLAILAANPHPHGRDVVPSAIFLHKPGCKGWCETGEAATRGEGGTLTNAANVEVASGQSRRRRITIKARVPTSMYAMMAGSTREWEGYRRSFLLLTGSRATILQGVRQDTHMYMTAFVATLSGRSSLGVHPLLGAKLRLSSLKPIRYTWSYLARTTECLVPIWQPLIGSSFRLCPEWETCTCKVLSVYGYKMGYHCAGPHVH